MMKKKLLQILSLTMIMVMMLALPVFASPSKDRAVDEAGLMSNEEVSRLNSLLNQLSDEMDFDIVVVTVPTLEGISIEKYADDYFDYNGFGKGSDGEDGAIIVYRVDNDDCYIGTCGRGIKVLTDAGIQEVGRPVRSNINSGRYYDAFEKFAELVADKAAPAAFPAVGYGVFAGIIGLLSGLIGTSSMKSKLKSVAFRSTAGEYAKRDTLNIASSTDQFLYSHVDRRAKPQQSSSSGSTTHVSSSGRTHGGGHI